MNADLIKARQEAHKKIMELWRQYQDLNKELLVTQGRLADLWEEAKKVGKQICELYKKSDNGLNSNG